MEEIIVALFLGGAVVVGGTFSSLFIAPFCEVELAEFGAIGCCQWSEPKGRIVERKVEKVICKEEARDTNETPIREIRLSNGQRIFLDYPGYDIIKKEISEYGSSYMMHKGKGVLRRFTNPKYREMKGGVAFCDIMIDGVWVGEPIEEGEMLQKVEEQLKDRNEKRREEEARLRMIIEAVEEHIRRQEWDLASTKCHEELSSAQHTREYWKEEDEVIWKLLLEKIIRSRELARIENVSKEVNELISQQQWDAAIEKCSQEIEEHENHEGREDVDLNIWEEKKRIAGMQKEIAESQENRKGVELMVENKEWDKVLEITKKELAPVYTQLSEEDRIFWSQYNKLAQDAIEAANKAAEREKEQKHIYELGHNLYTLSMLWNHEFIPPNLKKKGFVLKPGDDFMLEGGLWIERVYPSQKSFLVTYDKSDRYATYLLIKTGRYEELASAYYQGWGPIITDGNKFKFIGKHIIRDGRGFERDVLEFVEFDSLKK